MISKNFSETEWSCRDGCKKMIVVEKLVNMMQSFRDRIGKPIDVHCVNRCEKHNKEVGGVASSEHLTGSACDFHVSSMPIAELQAIVLSSEDIFTGGIGLYDTFVHVDTGKKRLWDNRNV